MADIQSSTMILVTECSESIVSNASEIKPDIGEISGSHWDKCEGVSLDVAPCILLETEGRLDIALLMEAVSTTETSVTFYEATRCNIPGDTHL
jgi:hypothetical protein